MNNDIKEIIKKLKNHLEGIKYADLSLYDIKLLSDYITNLQEKEIIMERYLELIVDLGYDYDGFNKVDSLKGLIDELVRYANLGRACNITKPIYEKDDKKYNILDEELGDDKDEI